MSVEKKLEAEVEEIVHTSTVERAQAVMQRHSGVGLLSVISFFESALPVPILTDLFLVGAILVNRVNAKRIVIATTVASVVGGVCTYLLALYFFDFILEWFSEETIADFHNLIAANDSNTFILTLVGALTPVPYTAVVWMVAVLKGSFTAFIAASVLGRGMRYAIVGYCTYRFGPAAVSYAKRYIGIVSLITLLLAAAYVLFKM